MPKVYVFASLMPMGGAYMAYHVGRLLHLHFGYEFVDVDIKNFEQKLFEYDIPIRSVGYEQMCADITEDDLLIVNPSYSKMLFGLTLPGKKIMYVQDYKTFRVLDCHFDLYVSVSALVQRYAHALYGLSTPVIPAFIELEKMPAAKPWDERPVGSALVYLKHNDPEHTLLLDYLVKRAPGFDLSRVVLGREMPHAAFLETLAQVRYLVNLSVSEGFGLVPLEAMALGTAVTGVDSLGGADYMRSGENCVVAPVTNMRGLPQAVLKIFGDEGLAARCVEAGKVTAQGYGYGAFKAAWLAQLASFLKREPAHD